MSLLWRWYAPKRTRRAGGAETEHQVLPPSVAHLRGRRESRQRSTLTTELQTKAAADGHAVGAISAPTRPKSALKAVTFPIQRAAGVSSNRWPLGWSVAASCPSLTSQAFSSLLSQRFANPRMSVKKGARRTTFSKELNPSDSWHIEPSRSTLISTRRRRRQHLHAARNRRTQKSPDRMEVAPPNLSIPPRTVD